MPTVQDVLKESGFTDDEIKALEPRAITAFSGVLTTAEKERVEAAQAREAAELAQRSNRDFYENQIAPSLNGWAEEKANYDAQLAYFKAQNESLKANGILPADAPGYQSRDGQGRYVAGGPNQTPGSPQFFDVNKVYARAGDAIGILSDISWEHQRLFGQPLPVSPTELIRQADAVKLDPKTYAARTFNWDARRKQMDEEKQVAHDNQIRSAALAENDKKWSERVGSNPDIRLPQPSRFADIARGVQAGQRKDPLMLNEGERRTATRTAIRNELSEA